MKYEDVKKKLETLCQNDGLAFAEKSYTNTGALCVVSKDKIVLNRNYRWFKEAPKKAPLH